MNDSQDATDEFVRGLRQLHPERTSLDTREAFFKAGFEACRAESESRTSRRLAFSVAATAAALIATVSASYHVGKTAGVSQITDQIAQQDRIALPSPDAGAERVDDKGTRPVENSEPDANLEGVETPAPRNNVIELAQERSQQRMRDRGWLNPLADIARSTWLDRQSDSMLSTSHATLFTRQSAMQNLSDFPFSLALTNRLPVDSGDESVANLSQDAPQPLAAGDFHAIAIGQEAAR